MSKVDWTKAPKGATHYFIGSPEPWRDCSGEKWRWFSSAGDWQNSCQLSASLMRREDLIPRPAAAWTGEGQPPSGVECEVIEGDRVNWEEGRKHLIGERVIVHASFINGCDQLMTAFEIPRTNKCYVILSRLLRPVRTPEQIAAEERKLQREQLACLIAGYMGFDDPREVDTKLAAYIFDHEYRKQVAP